jgi:hypothetical protein
MVLLGKKLADDAPPCPQVDVAWGATVSACEAYAVSFSFLLDISWCGAAAIEPQAEAIVVVGLADFSAAVSSTLLVLDKAGKDAPKGGKAASSIGCCCCIVCILL